MPKKAFFVKESELDDFQVKIINKRTDNSFIVKGCAGSGKSILALWKAKQIQEEKKGTYQIIVFTKALKQYISDGIKQIGIDANNVDYHTNWKQRGAPSSDFIIVDEAQDFSESDIIDFKQKAKHLLLYGDSAQQLYDGRANMDRIIAITDFQSEQLVFNHRLPKKIARLAEYVICLKDSLEERCKNEGAELPYILNYTSFESQLDAIAEIVKNRNFTDVGILLMKNSDVQRAYDYFKAKGINIEAKFDIKGLNENNRMTLDFNSDNPKIMTYHSAKGLQFEAVFMPNCDCSDDFWRNPLYVAITRSYQSLYIMYSGNQSRFFANVPTNLYLTSLNKATTELL